MMGVLVVRFLKMERKGGCRVISACGGIIRTRERVGFITFSGSYRVVLCSDGSVKVLEIL